MKKQIVTKIYKAILAIIEPHPNEDLIVTYRDFLKVRDVIHLYKYNLTVLESLIDIAYTHWNKDFRINRLLLLRSINRYASKDGHGISALHIESKRKAFQLFRMSFEEPEHLMPRQVDEIRRLCNRLIMNLTLTSEEELWLCANAMKSEIILNRTLRYPSKSTIITNWTRENFRESIFRNRRAEHLSWIIDEDAEFDIDNQTLFEDFEFLNTKDLSAIQEYKEEIAANTILENELDEFLPKLRLPSLDGDNDFVDTDISDLSKPELKLSSRFYNVPLEKVDGYLDAFPDFEQLGNNFYRSISLTQKVTMIWAIAYSRADNKVKEILLRKYYHDDTLLSMLKVAKKFKFLNLLEWMLKQYGKPVT